MMESHEIGYQRSNAFFVGAISIICAAVIIVGLVYGRSFLVPIVIAILIVTLLRAMAEQLRRISVPSSLAMLVSLMLFMIVILAMGRILTGQIDAVSEAWPRYVQRFEVLASDLSSWAGTATTEKLRLALAEFNLRSRIPALMGSAGGIFANTILVILYVGFLLAGRGLLADRVQMISSDQQKAGQIVQILNEIGHGVRKYIWIKTIMSVLTALASYIVLKFLKIDFAETWALLIFLLNFIPSIGSILGVVFPAILALVQFDTMWQFMVIAVALTAMQFIIGNVIEPAVMGRTLNLSPFIVMVSLTFWSIIWGVVGAFLSVPLTATIVIILSHIPACRWIALLIADDVRAETGRADPD